MSSGSKRALVLATLVSAALLLVLWALLNAPPERSAEIESGHPGGGDAAASDSPTDTNQPDPQTDPDSPKTSAQKTKTGSAAGGDDPWKDEWDDSWDGKRPGSNKTGPPKPRAPGTGLGTPYGTFTLVRGFVLDATGMPRSGARVRLFVKVEEGDLTAEGLKARRRRSRVEGPPTKDLAWVVGQAVLTRWSRDDGVPVGEGRSSLGGAFEIRVASTLTTQARELIIAADDPKDGAAGIGRLSVVPLLPKGVLEWGQLVVHPTSTVTVRAHSGGVALEGVEVSIKTRMLLQQTGGWGPDWESVQFRAKTDSTGATTFLLQGLQVSLELTKAGYAASRRRIARLRAKDEVVVHMPAGVRLEGRIRDPAGKPVPDVWVTAYPRGEATRDGGAGPVSTKGDDQGRFVLGGLLSGQTYEVRAVPRSGKLVLTTRVVTPPAAELNLVLQRAGAILVTVQWQETKDADDDDDDDFRDFTLDVERRDPVSGVWTELESGDVPYDGDERLITGLPPGTYRVRATSSGMHATSPPVEVRVGEEPARTVVKLLTGRKVKGRVVDVVGSPMADVLVGINYRTPSTRVQVTLRTDERGRFELEDLPRDALALVVSREGFGAVSLELKADMDDLGDIRLVKQ